MANAQAAAPKAGNWASKMKFYVVVMGGYYAYKFYKLGGKSPEADTTTTARKGAGTEYDCQNGSENMHRQFEKIGGSWVSSLQAGACSENQLLLLHRTSLSAETEFGTMIPQLITKATPSGGLQVVAADRPCHGYSPCPGEGEDDEEAGGTLGRLIARRPGAQQFAYLASGRDAARQALAIVQRRKAPTRMLLLRPMMVTPDAKGVTASIGIDSARWAVLKDESTSSKEDPLEPLTVAKMPRGCVVTLMYLDGDKEDEALRAALEEQDVAVDVRYMDSFEEGVVPAVSDMLATDGASTADTEAVDEEV